MYVCKQCQRSFETFKSVARHSSVKHGIKLDQSYVDHNLNGVWPLCKCGCGCKVKWSYQLKDFCEFCQGHQSRVNNNWGHNKAVLQKSIETRRERFASGEITVWNKGLDTSDERVKNNIEKSMMAINSDPNELLRRSNLMRQQRKNGTIPTLHGKDHSQWKGGTSSINVLVRARQKLYKEWKYPILIRDGFKCVECGSTKDLQVHHDKERMCEIIERHMVDEMNPDTFEEKEFIADAVVDYHIKNSVSGVTICRECHGKIHPSLNFV